MKKNQKKGNGQDNMEIINRNIDSLIPYERNPRNNTSAIKYVAESIKQFGFKVPIVIDKNNVIVCGHTRYSASKQLGLTEVPCIIADDLTDEQIKAYRLADNKVGEKSKWDIDMLNLELDDIINIDMYDFGFDYEDEFQKENERHRTVDTYNLGLIDFNEKNNEYWEMPEIKNDNIIPTELIGFNYAKTSKNKKVGIHFYLDDYQFERIWNNPEKYIDILREYECILSPDFSLYTDMPFPMKIWNVYRSRIIGQFYQRQGIKVIPTISWAEEKTFDFCFKGIEKNGIVSISTIGIKKNKEAFNIWKQGVDRMITELNPHTILIYGGEVDYDFQDINIVYFDNRVTEKLKGR